MIIPHYFRSKNTNKQKNKKDKNLILDMDVARLKDKDRLCLKCPMRNSDKLSVITKADIGSDHRLVIMTLRMNKSLARPKITKKTNTFQY